jgi:predicted acetyltransferase
MTMPRNSTPAPPVGLRLRPADSGDLRPLAELFNFAFPREKSVEERMKGLATGGVFGGIETAFVAEDETGRLAGAFRAYRFTLHLHGYAWPVLGLAAVAVAPAFRRRGVGRWMCGEAHRIGLERGDLLSLLFPFRTDFYSRMGYALTGTLHRYRFALADLPLSLGWEGVEWVPRQSLDEVRALHARLIRLGNGGLDRTDRMWGFLSRDRWSVHLHRDAAGVPQGYLVASLRPGRSGGLLEVRELLAGTDEAREALLGWIAAQRDQATEGLFDALPSDDFGERLANPRRPRSPMVRELWFSTATVLRGPMARVLDPAAALQRMGVDASPEDLPALDSPAALATFTRRFVAGTLPHQRPAPGWEPSRGSSDFQLLDPF